MPSGATSAAFFVHVASHFVIKGHKVGQAKMFSSYLQSTQTYPFSSLILLSAVIVIPWLQPILSSFLLYPAKINRPNEQETLFLLHDIASPCRVFWSVLSTGVYYTFWSLKSELPWVDFRHLHPRTQFPATLLIPACVLKCLKVCFCAYSEMLLSSSGSLLSLSCQGCRKDMLYLRPLSRWDQNLPSKLWQETHAKHRNHDLFI